GDKLRARAVAEAADVPVVPGGEVRDARHAVELAARLGAPLLIKAVGGGGGRGMKRVDDLAQLPVALDLAAAEAGAAFGDARVYLERYVARGRHVEVQVLGNGRGAAVQLGERDCSVQRRYQKLIEETPAPGLDDNLRQALQEAALRITRSLAYRGAGTVEFLVDVPAGAFYFLEMNARIQVEHPVTEMVTGIDLVAEQFHIAAGGALRLAPAAARPAGWASACRTQAEHPGAERVPGVDLVAEQCHSAAGGALRMAPDAARPAGWAIECRINAEDPARDFTPSPGTVTQARWPAGEGIRVDTHIIT